MLIYKIKNGMNIIYADESIIQLKNSNLQVQHPKFDSFNYSSINQGKVNLILGVTKNKFIHYELKEIIQIQKYLKIF